MTSPFPTPEVSRRTCSSRWAPQLTFESTHEESFVHDSLVWLPSLLVGVICHSKFQASLIRREPRNLAGNEEAIVQNSMLCSGNAKLASLLLDRFPRRILLHSDEWHVGKPNSSTERSLGVKIDRYQLHFATKRISCAVDQIKRFRQASRMVRMPMRQVNMLYLAHVGTQSLHVLLQYGCLWPTVHQQGPLLVAFNS